MECVFVAPGRGGEGMGGGGGWRRRRWVLDVHILARQHSDTSRATVNVLDCCSPEINAVISSWRRRARVRRCNAG